MGISALPNPSVQLIPHVLYWGQIWTYGGHASGGCYCLPGNPDKLGQHVVGHCPAAESDYVVAQAGLQQDARSHPYTLLRSYCPQQ